MILCPGLVLRLLRSAAIHQKIDGDPKGISNSL